MLGQPDYTTGEWPLELTAANFVPYIIWSNGLQLIVVDPEANRILVWDEFPTKNAQPATTVLGQQDFFTSRYPDETSAGTFRLPAGLAVHRDKLIVLDMYSDRALIFEAK